MTPQQRAAIESAIATLEGYWEAAELRALLAASAPNPSDKQEAVCSMCRKKLMARVDHIDDQGYVHWKNAIAQSAEQDRIDAERWRRLLEEHFPTAHKPPIAQVVWKCQSDRHGSKWVNMIDGNDLIDHIDALIAKGASK